MRNTKKRKLGNVQIKDLGIATRFKPGQSGNPGGRPKTRVVAEMLAAIGHEVEAKSNKTFFQLAAEVLLEKVFKGDVQAFKEFADRVDGRTTQNVELRGALHLEHSRSDWEDKYHAATPEEQEQMRTDIDDRVLAAAERIKAERAGTPPVTPEERYRARMAEYTRRSAAGESLQQIQASWQSADVN